MNKAIRKYRIPRISWASCSMNKSQSSWRHTRRCRWLHYSKTNTRFAQGKSLISKKWNVYSRAFSISHLLLYWLSSKLLASGPHPKKPLTFNKSIPTSIQFYRAIIRTLLCWKWVTIFIIAVQVFILHRIYLFIIRKIWCIGGWSAGLYRHQKQIG